tara:strand:- start:108824 stop:109537 length:714 start_codon:yes stop_codon:yes gene_type:complete
VSAEKNPNLDEQDGNDLEEFYKHDPSYNPSGFSVEHGVDVDGGTITIYPTNKWSIFLTLAVTCITGFFVISVATFLIMIPSMFVVIPYSVFLGVLSLVGYFFIYFGKYFAIRPKLIRIRLDRMGIYIEDQVLGKTRKRAFALGDGFKFVAARSKKTYKLEGRTHFINNFRLELHDRGHVYCILEDASEYGLRAVQSYCYNNGVKYAVANDKVSIVPFFYASILLVFFVAELKYKGII